MQRSGGQAGARSRWLGLREGYLGGGEGFIMFWIAASYLLLFKYFPVLCIMDGD